MLHLEAGLVASSEILSAHTNTGLWPFQQKALSVHASNWRTRVCMQQWAGVYLSDLQHAVVGTASPIMGGGVGETLMAVRGSGGGLPMVCGPLLWATQYAHDFCSSCDNTVTLLLSQLRLPPLGHAAFSVQPQLGAWLLGTGPQEFGSCWPALIKGGWDGLCPMKAKQEECWEGASFSGWCHSLCLLPCGIPWAFSKVFFFFSQLC